jgi:hypothetical protein
MVRISEIPLDSLLARYVASGAYADCYVAELPNTVTHAQFVEAFYTTALFKLERLLLRVFMARPSTDAQARQLAKGEVSSFAAWSVEARADNQLVLAAGRTRSWLMVSSSRSTLPVHTKLFFGSAVVPVRASAGARPALGFVFTVLLGFHKLYSRALLWSAHARLVSQTGGRNTHRSDA